MRFRSFAMTCVVSLLTFAGTPVSAECGGDNAIATAIANEGDRERTTNLDRAIVKYQEALDAAPQSQRILMKLASAHQKREAWDQVAAVAEKAIALSPRHAGYVELRGVALARLASRGNGEWADARRVLERALELDPDLPDAHYELADVCLHLGEDQCALEHFTSSVKLKPSEAVRYAQLADLYLRLRYEPQAEMVLKAGEARSGDESKKFVLYTLHGDLLDGRGDIPASVAKYELAKKACGACDQSGERIAFFNLGAAYASLTPPRKAESIANLQVFMKTICKGAAAARYADQCMQAQQLAMKMGGALQ